MAELILLTGISGFVAKHVALKFLAAGYAVRGTLRRLDRAAEVRAALAPHLDAAALGRLGFVLADLEAEAGWATAMDGVAAVVHTASPFPIVEPADPDVLIRPAVQGTMRVLRAARLAGVLRVVVTSSTVSVQDRRQKGVQDEEDWCNPDGASAYARSKILAERAAWDFAGREGLQLTTINPGFVLGPPLDAHFGSSVGVVRRLMRGRDPMVPMIGFVVVDVRDVAEMHLRAVQQAATVGKRYLAAGGSMTMPDMARVLKQAYPRRRIPTMVAPKIALRVLGLFDRQIRAAADLVGYLPEVSNARATAEMGMDFATPAAALKATADWLVKAGQV
ncbi:MAG: NAD-dependent epimerase/dehydratase family protein [bacterium]